MRVKVDEDKLEYEDEEKDVHLKDGNKEVQDKDKNEDEGVGIASRG